MGGPHPEDMKYHPPARTRTRLGERLATRPATALLFLTALQPLNAKPAEILLNPRPKKLIVRDGAFSTRENMHVFLHAKASQRTVRTADMFANRYFAYTGRRLETKTFDAILPGTGITLRISDFATFNGRLVRVPADGYCLISTPRAVRITGGDEPGLYYGMITFFQLIRALNLQTTMPIPALDILDWPDVGKRIVGLAHFTSYRDLVLRENYGIRYLMDWTERWVAGQKANILCLDLSSGIRYKWRSEFNGRERIYSLKDLQTFAAFCREHFVEVCPAWNVGGHSDTWLLPYHPELRETGWLHQANILHPEYDKIVTDCMYDGLVHLAPRYLFSMSTDWWAARKPGETPAYPVDAKSRPQAFLDLQTKLHRWLDKKDIRMLLSHDMLSPLHNGARYDVHTVLDQMPTNIVIVLNNDTKAAETIPFFRQKGFDVWMNPTSDTRLPAETAAHLDGYGHTVLSFGNNQAALAGTHAARHSISTVVRGADHAWNLLHDHAPHAHRRTALLNMLALKPNRYADETVTPLDIRPRMTHAFAEFLRTANPAQYARHRTPIAFRGAVHRIGHIPMLLASDKNRNCIILRKNSMPAPIPLNARYSSLVFLHTAYINNPADPAVAGQNAQKWPYGYPCGRYSILYEDESKLVVPLRLTMNLRRCDANPENPATAENRYVCVLKDANNKPVHLYQYEWVNPKPLVRIARLAIEHDHELDVSLIVFAVSGRRVWTGRRMLTPVR